MACVSASVALMCAPAAMAELGAILSAPHGDVWFTEPTANRIGEIRSSGVVSWLQVPTTHSEPGGLSVGPGGEIWFTEPKAGKIGQINSRGAISEFSVPLPPANPPTTGPLGIGPPLKSSELPGPGVLTAGPDGNLWFTYGGGSYGISSVYGGQIDRITPSGTISEYQIPSQNSEPHRIVSGPDGNLWFTESTLNGGVIGRTTPSGAVTTFALPEQHEPGGIATGPDGALWFADVVFGPKRITGMIGRINPAGAIRYFPLPTPEAQPADIALGADGAMWFTAAAPRKVALGSKGRRSIPSFAGRIGRITPKGQVTEFAVRQPPLEIVRGPHDEMLFTQESSNEIGRVTLSGKVSEIPIPSPGRCVVPRLRTQTLDAAKKMLSRANCKLGKVARPKTGSRKLVVASQSPAAGTTLPAGARVAVRLD